MDRFGRGAKAMIIPASYLYPDLGEGKGRARQQRRSTDEQSGRLDVAAEAAGGPSPIGALASGMAVLVGIVAYGGLMELVL